MKRILIVDDLEANRYYLESLLRGHGYEPFLARHGAEALAMARRSLPDAVVSDLLMPVMDGYTLLRYWKSEPQLREIPFVVYTATYTEPEDERLARELGADAFFVKPMEPETFLGRLRQVTAAPGTSPTQWSLQDSESREETLEAYSRALIRKLEEKSIALEAANKALLEDIGRREAAEAALRISEERFRLLARATNDAIWDLDLDTGVRWWGEGFKALFGHAEGQASCQQLAWAELLHPDDRERVLRAFGQVLEEGQDIWSAKYRFRRADGSWAIVQDRARVIRGVGGRALRMVGGLSDITQRVTLEEQLHRSQRLEAIGRLTGGVVHDFNNFLMVVTGAAELLVPRVAADPEAQALVIQCLEAAQRGTQLCHRLLAFARKQSLSPKPTDVGKVIGNLRSLLERLLDRRIELVLECAHGLPEAMVDPAQLENAILNLVTNARDAMPTGGTLAIRTSLHTAPDGLLSLLIEVSDTGIGVSPEQIDRLFEPFYTTKAERKGTGLGLAMVYGFVQQSKGRVAVDSEPGKGTSFSLYLPLAEVVASAQGSDRGLGLAVPPVQAPARILVVDDDELSRRSVCARLISLGHQVATAKDGEEALALLRGPEHFDLLLTDVVMAGIDGPVLAQAARELRPELKVLFSSGYEGFDRLTESTLQPMLRKPYHRAELAMALSAILGPPSVATVMVAETHGPR